MTDRPAGWRGLDLALGIASLLTLLWVCGRSAWVGEDAHITFRTIDNFVGGYGLRWNVDERVQTYTHPLWMLVNASIYYFTREIYTTTTVLGLLFSAGAFAVAADCFRERRWVWLAGIATPLLLSGAFVRYTTSGFENSLSFFLLALFARLLLSRRCAEYPPWLGLGLVAGLAVVNRLDTLVIYLPPLALLIARHGRQVRWGRLLAGISPALLWFAFSTLYYGFALPNTALAKLNEEIPLGEYITQGMVYAADLLAADSVSFALIAFAAVAAVLAATSWLSGRARDGVDGAGALAIGSTLYALYVIGVGGDFLSGRFWALPVFASTIVFAARLDALARWLRELSAARRSWLAVAILGLAAVVHLAAPDWTELARSRGIIEMPVSHKYLDRDLRWAATDVARSVEAFARQAREIAEQTGERQVTVGSAVGFSGFYSGPLFTIIDVHALTDALLARLPPTPGESWRIGHFERTPPQGYLHARKTGCVDRMTPAMRDYYSVLRQITSGPLFAPERLRAIADFHLGRVRTPGVH